MQYSNGLINLPEALVIEIESESSLDIELQNLLNIDIHNSDLFNIIFKVLKNKSQAQLEIDYLCLDLLADAHYNHITEYDALNYILNRLREKCLLIHQQLLSHNLYIKNKLVYTVIGLKRDKLFLQRQDLFYKQLIQDLKVNEQHEANKLHFARYY